MSFSVSDNRIVWIDIAKAAAIWMVVMAHILRKGAVTDYSGAAALAVFFYLAGRTFSIRSSGHIKSPEKDALYSEGKGFSINSSGHIKSPEKDALYSEEKGFSVNSGGQIKSVKEFALHLIKRILIPYLLAGLISILIFRILGSFAAGKMGVELKGTSLSEDILHLLYANSNDGRMKWNESLWFLPCYMCTQILAYALERIISAASFIKRNAAVFVRSAVSFLAAMAGIWLTGQGNYHALFWHFETALLVFPLFEAGILVKIFAGTVPAHKSCRVRYLGGAVFLIASLLIMGKVWDEYAVFCIRTGEMTGPLHGYCMLALAAAGIIFPAKFASTFGTTALNASVVGASTTDSPIVGAQAHGTLAFEASTFGTQALNASGVGASTIDSPAFGAMVLAPVRCCGQHTLEILLWNKFPVLLIQILLPMVIPGAAALFNGSPTERTVIIAALLAVPCMILCLIFDPPSMYTRLKERKKY